MRLVTALHVALIILLFSVVSGAASEPSTAYRERGVTVVHTDHAHPFCFMGSDGYLRGMVIDLWDKWSEETGIPVEFAITSWKDTITAVIGGKYDIHGGLMVTDERKPKLEFSQPLFTVSTALIARKGEGFDKQSLIDKAVIGIVAGGSPGRDLKAAHPGIRIKEYDTPDLVVDALAERDVAGVVMDVPTFHFNNIERTVPVQYEVLTVLSTKDIHAAVPKGNIGLLAIIDEGFSKIDAKEREIIQNRWFVVMHEEEQINYLYWVGGAALLIVVALLVSRWARGRFPVFSEVHHD